MTTANFLMTSFMALLGAYGILRLIRSGETAHPPLPLPVPDTPVLLFRDGELVDATPCAADIVGAATTSLKVTCEILAPTFPDLHDVVKNSAALPARVRNPHDSTQWANVSSGINTIRIELVGEFDPHDPMITPPPALLEDINAYSPQLIWQQDMAGRTIWANDAYLQRSGQDVRQIPELFANLRLDPTDQHPSTQRLAVSKDPPQWFDITTVVRDGYFLHFANDATAVMRADQDRREFVQTLGKTFADLSIGLAIFDKKRQLAMFNPAFFDMTNLPVDFLSGQPSINMVLDRLRELRMMPEPKNYSTWREQFSAVETAAKNGTYSENWSLPDGQTYRVTGKPHPDGAFAFLFEDISAEVSLTRRFRSDIETSQAVLDTLPEAIAVFSGAGTMVMSNQAYGKLWQTEDELMLAHRDVETEVSQWQDNCIASPMWTQMRNFIQRVGMRDPWSEDAMLSDGRHLRCHATSIAGGMTMVRFVIAPPMRPVIQKLTQVDPAIRAAKV